MRTKKTIFAVLYIVFLMQTAYAAASKNPGLYISPETVFKNKQDYTLIDIRNSAEFKLAHIPGSINLPINSIAKKKYLRTRNLILINKGYDSSSILKRCVEFKKDGFYVLVLKGGINSWAIRELPLFGSKNISNILKINPLELYKSLNSTSWLAVNFSGTSTDNKYLNKLETIISPKPNTLAGKNELLNSINKIIQNRKLLIYNKDGTEYSTILKIIKNQREVSLNSTTVSNNIFFLKGGSDQFNLFTKRVLRFPAARKILSDKDDCGCN